MRKSRPKKVYVPECLPGDVRMAANHTLRGAQEKYIATMHPWEYSVRDILDLMWTEEVLNDCERGWTACARIHRAGSTSYTLPDGTLMHLDTDSLHILAPNPDLAVTQCPEPIYTHLMMVRETLRKFAQVWHVMGYFADVEATPSAFRAYCPWIKTLTQPCHHAIMEKNFREPPHLATVLPMIREVNGFMASLSLLQLDRTADNKGITFNLKSEEFTAGQRIVTVDAFQLEV